MTEIVVFPDVVRGLIPFLTARLTARGLAAPVSSRVPNPRPARLVKVSAAGGNLTSIATANTLVLVECWAADELAAHDLAEVCATEMRAATRSQDPIAAGVWIGGFDDAVSIPVNFPDPLTSSARFQFTASLHISGEATSTTPPPTPVPSVTVVDNGDGTYTLTGVTDNGDGTWTWEFTDNGDGTFAATG